MISEKSIYHETGAHFFTTVVPIIQEKSQQSIQENWVYEFPIHSALKLPLCELVVLIDMNTHILVEGRNFKTFLKKMQLP